MMKRNNVFTIILFIESLFLPIVVIVMKLFSYTLKIGNGIIFAVIATLVYYVVGILLMINKDKQVGKVQAVLLALTLLLNQINSLFFIFSSENILAMSLIASWFIMTVVIVAVYVKNVGLKVTFYAISGVLSLPVSLFVLLSSFGANNVVASEVSPYGMYCAEVISNDQGALGGATILRVYKYYDSFSIGSFEFRKEQKDIYQGEWNEYENLYWIDDVNLIMNEDTYVMSDYFRLL